MRHPAETIKKVTTRYWNTWRAWLDTPPAAPISFPLDPPTAASVSSQQEAVHEWLIAWRTWGTVHPYASMRATTLKTVFGRQDVVTHLDFPDIAALAAVTDTTNDHWERAQVRHGALGRLDLARGVVKPLLQALVSLDDADFAILLAAVDWFTANPRSGLTVRQVPVVGMHTKWLSRHRGLVWGLLGKPGATSTDGEEGDDIPPEALDQLGLKPVPRHIDIILTDPNERRRVGGLRHLNAPPGELAALPIRPAMVLIVENKESALPIPDVPGLVVIHSLGNHLGVLAELPWIPDQVLYWGDLDRAGMTLLSRARQVLPHLRSVLMDEHTLADHQHLAVADTTKADSPSDTLHAQEVRVLGQINQGEVPLRLEQERIPWVRAWRALSVRLNPHEHAGANGTSTLGSSSESELR